MHIIDYDVQKIKNGKLSVKDLDIKNIMIFIYDDVIHIFDKDKVVNAFCKANSKKDREIRRKFFSHCCYFEIDDKNMIKISDKNVMKKIKKDKYYILIKNNFEYKILSFSDIHKLTDYEKEIINDLYKSKYTLEKKLIKEEKK